MKTKIKSVVTALALIFTTQFSSAVTPDELYKAIQSGDEDKAISLIAGVDLNAVNADGSTFLTTAACFFPKVTKALIDAKADVNLPTKNGITPLANACRWGNAETVKMLIDAGADVNKETAMGTALLASFNYSSAPIVKMLLDAGAKFKEQVKMMNLSVDPFMQYIKTVKTPIETVEYYGKNKESWSKLPIKFPDRVMNPKESDFSSIVDVVKVFIDKGLDINKTYTYAGVKQTALDAAMQDGFVEASKVLMDAGATYDAEKEIKVRDRSGNQNAKLPNITFTNGDYVLGAVLSNNFEFVKFMGDKYPKLLKKFYEGKGTQRCVGGATNYDAKGVDLLMIAAERGNVEIVKYLIGKGAGRGKTVEVKEYKGDTYCPMFTVMFTMGFARNSGNKEIIELVKSSGFGKE